MNLHKSISTSHFVQMGPHFQVLVFGQWQQAFVWIKILVPCTSVEPEMPKSAGSHVSQAGSPPNKCPRTVCLGIKAPFHQLCPVMIMNDWKIVQQTIPIIFQSFFNHVPIMFQSFPIMFQSFSNHNYVPIIHNSLFQTSSRPSLDD